MDPQNGDGRPAPERRLTSIGKYLQKIKTALGWTSTTKDSRTATALTPEHSLDNPIESSQPLILAPTPVITATSRTQSPVKVRSPLTIVSEGGMVTSTAQASTVNPPTTIAQSPLLTRSHSNPLPSSLAQDRRTLALFERYGHALKPADNALYNRLGTVERVEKRARVRVHYYCHRCQSSFGLEGVCTKCEHKRCKRCTRFPECRVKENAAKKTILPRDWDKDPLAARHSSSFKTKRSTLPMAIKSIKTKRSSLPMVFSVTTIHPSEIKASAAGTWRPLTLQRAHHTCHHCRTPFIRSERVYQECAHFLCTKCPQHQPRAGLAYNKLLPATEAEQSDMITGTEPSAAIGTENRKLQNQHRLPERTYKLPRQRVRYTCDRCNVLFEENGKTCKGCGHWRCQSCGRIPPKRNQPPDPDPAGVKFLEARLAALDIVDAAPSTSVQLWVDAVGVGNRVKLGRV